MECTKEHPCPGPAGLFQRNPSVLQRSVHALDQLLLLRVHLFHFIVADPKKLVIKLVEAEKKRKKFRNIKLLD